ncbi:MAG: helix-turn-helix transcriptional regulator [Myxococcota bacterium]
MSSLSASARPALRAAEEGDHGVLVELLADLDLRSEPAAQAWRVALQAYRWLAMPKKGSLPTIDVLRGLGDSLEEREALGFACVALERAAVLSFDGQALGELVALHASVSEGHPELALRLELARLWSVLFAGSPSSELEERAREAAVAGHELALPDLVVETTAARAFGALVRQDLPYATALARRASRMGRTEGLPQSEYLANLVLARVRRSAGQAHLATRILSALARVVPEGWRAWLAWERQLAGASGEVLPASSQALASLLEAAQRAHPPAFAAAQQELMHKLQHATPMRSEAEVVVALVGGFGEPESAVSWLRGVDAGIPLGLHGLALAHGPPDALALVSCRPGESPRRLLAVGQSLLPSDHTYVHSERPGRVESAIATLALAGPEGLDDEEFFLRVYGFRFAERRHAGTMNVLLHRVRSRLEDVAELGREGRRLSLRAHRAFVVPDPRCNAPTGDQILRLVATRTRCTAKEAAEALGLPLRTVQHTLQRLADEGACAAGRQGRRIEYRVEDTTFREATNVR